MHHIHRATLEERKKQCPEEGWRRTVYIIIFEADTPLGKLFDVVLLFAILIGIALISLETVPDLAQYAEQMRRLEWIITLLFTTEYVLRLLCVRKPLRYGFSFWGLIDLVSFLPTYIVFFAGTNVGSFALVRAIRLLRVFRVLKLLRLMSEADELYRSVWESREKIVVFLFTIIIAVTLSGALMYHIENWADETVVTSETPVTITMREAPSSDVVIALSSGDADAETDNEVTFTPSNWSEPKGVVVAHSETVPTGSSFTSIPQSMYWAIVTMTTVGYGDVVPKTPFGKAISAMLILLGYSLIIVPTGFVTAKLSQSANQGSRGSPPHDRPPQQGERQCDQCGQGNHPPDAAFCNRCGAPLPPAP